VVGASVLSILLYYVQGQYLVGNMVDSFAIGRKQGEVRKMVTQAGRLASHLPCSEACVQKVRRNAK